MGSVCFQVKYVISCKLKDSYKFKEVRGIESLQIDIGKWMAQIV